MNQTNRGVPGSRVGRASGEPVLAEVGPPFMLSLDVAGYCSVLRTLRDETLYPVDEDAVGLVGRS